MHTAYSWLPEEDVSNASILIVDDNPTNLKVLFDYLERHGFDILVARNSESALQRAAHAKPDIILLDVVMPETDGFSTCLRLKADQRTRSIPVIFMTALASPDNKVKGFEVGGVDYVTKPLQYEEVLARVTTHLRLRSLQQRLETQNTLLQRQNARLEQEIAQRARMEQRLKCLNQELQASHASKDTLFSIIAHDLRAPFSALLGLSETVVHYIDDYSKAEIRENMLKIRSSSEAVYSLLENLLAWSRLQRGVLPYQPHRIVVHDIVEDTLALFTTQAEQKQIDLHHLIASDVMVYADKSMLATILRNLLSNALKFTGSGGKIELSASCNEDYTEIAVTDTGIGMSPDTISQLFRLNTPITRVGTDGEHGTGLGLSLCKELVEKQQGTLWVESTEGGGSTFRFTLPCCQQQAV